MDSDMKAYNIGHEPLLTGRRFSYDTFNTIVERHAHGGTFREEYTGYSYEGRPIRVLTGGRGSISVLAWSQMHGNEPTSTLALLDAMNFLESGDNMAQEILSAVNITVIPLLNPDGYLRYDRRNAQGIDINRDARRLMSPEAKLLMSAWERHKPYFALNLHDQETRYVSTAPLTSTQIAMLAPECSEDKRVTPARENAMKVIASVATALAGNAPGQTSIAKYDDVYTPSAFGDTFMKLGTSSILIETGSSHSREREIPRSIVGNAIVHALWTIATGEYRKHDVAEYDNLPLNRDFDGFEMILKNVTVCDPLGEYRADLGICRVKPSCNPEDFADDSDDFRVLNIGDLDDAPAKNTYDMQGYRLNIKHGDLYAGCKADFDLHGDNGAVVNTQKLLTNNPL